jgi:hypothetical protein
MRKIPAYKNSLKILLTAIIIFSWTTLLPPNLVRAQTKAESTYEVRVEVLPDGETFLEYKIVLTNQSDHFFIRDYALIFDHTDLIDLQVFENKRVANFRKERIDDVVRVKVYLDKQLVNKSDSTNITVRYSTDQLYRQVGLLRNLFVPPLKTEEELISASIKLEIPKDFNDIGYISVSGKEFQSDENNKYLEYTQEDAPFGLLILFGQKQQFEFTYNYKLENNTDLKKSYTITLPADSEFQKTYFIDASFFPERVLSDLDGNNIVEYTLEPQETKEVRISGFTHFSMKDEEVNLSESIKDLYLEESEIWDYSSDEGRSTINKITRSDYSQADNTKFIFDYLVSNYTYKSEVNGERQKSSDVLKGTKELTCENFSDLFVSLARGSGIAARGVIGYSNIDNNIGTLHYWAEYFDSDGKMWVGIDPCIQASLGYQAYEDLDLSRMILAYRGVSYDKPEVITPFQKLQDLDNDSLEIKASSYDYLDSEQTVNFSYEVNSPDIFFRSLPLNLHLRNNSQSIFRFKRILIDGNEIQLEEFHILDQYYEAIYPGQENTFSINISNLTNFSFEKVENYDLEVQGEFGENEFKGSGTFAVNRPFTYYSALSWFVALTIAIITLGVFLILVKKLKVKKRVRKKSKYKYKHRKSKMGGLMDIPVDLR